MRSASRSHMNPATDSRDSPLWPHRYPLRRSCRCRSACYKRCSQCRASGQNSIPASRGTGPTGSRASGNGSHLSVRRSCTLSRCPAALRWPEPRWGTPARRLPPARRPRPPTLPPASPYTWPSPQGLPYRYRSASPPVPHTWDWHPPHRHTPCQSGRAWVPRAAKYIHPANPRCIQCSMSP